jgi:SNO glutamine amidotransferase family
MRPPPNMPTARDSVTIGILGMYLPRLRSFKLKHRPQALQGAFAEHQTALERLSVPVKVVVVLVRTVDELATCDALIIPGGGMYRTSQRAPVHTR